VEGRGVGEGVGGEGAVGVVYDPHSCTAPFFSSSSSSSLPPHPPPSPRARSTGTASRTSPPTRGSSR